MKSRVLETRTDRQGLIRRRRIRDDGVEFNTVEIPVEVWNGFANSWQRSGKTRLQGWLDKRARKAQHIKAEIYFARGWKLAAIASELGVPERTLSDVRKHWKARNGR